MKNADGLQDPVSPQTKKDMVIRMNSLQNYYVSQFKHSGRGRKPRTILH